MRIVALEEHFATAEIRAAWSKLSPDLQDRSSGAVLTDTISSRLEEVGENRIAVMDAAGIDVQVLSLTTPAVQSLDPSDAVKYAQQSNDLIAAAMQQNPNRFQGFATIATPSPKEAVLELERAIQVLNMQGGMLVGRTRDRNLDHPDFLPIFEAAASMKIPLYVHPQVPQESVRKTYFEGFGEPLSSEFATLGWGWHAETGIQALRLILAGTFDRCPSLQLILGHWGETVLFFLERIDSMSRAAHALKRPIAEYVKNNFYVTPSGILSRRYWRWATEVLGPERILFATDFPFLTVSRDQVNAFLDEPSMTDKAREMLCFRNWETLTSRKLNS